MEKFFQNFHDLHFDISFADALILMPKFTFTIKSLLTNKDKLFELAKVPLNENCSAMLLKKLPEAWRSRQMIDYSLWEVIENGNAPPITQVVEGVETTIAPTTAEEKAQRRLELKVRSTLLMGIPNEHQLKFNSIKDVKSLLQAVEKKLQKLISQLEIHGESISQEDINQKFLRSLGQRDIKLKHKHTKCSLVSSNSTINTNGAINTDHGATTASTQATAINSTIIDNLSDAVIYAFFASQLNSPQLNNEDLQQIHPDDLDEMDLRWEMAMLTMRARRFLKNTRRNFSMNGNETIGFDKYKVECYNYDKKRHFAKESRALRSQDTKHKENTRKTVHVETSTSVALISCDRLGEEFVNEPIVTEPTVKKPVVETSKAKTSANKPKVVRKNFCSPLIKYWISNSEDEAESKPKIENKIVKPSFAKIEFVKSKEQVKSHRKTTVEQGDQNRPNTHNPRGNQRNWNNMMS
nr:ribonuclease H-like domain-containing protein [Tanacetum cinerariifolium]